MWTRRREDKQLAQNVSQRTSNAEIPKLFLDPSFTECRAGQSHLGCWPKKLRPMLWVTKILILVTKSLATTLLACVPTSPLSRSISDLESSQPDWLFVLHSYKNVLLKCTVELSKWIKSLRCFWLSFIPNKCQLARLIRTVVNKNQTLVKLGYVLFRSRKRIWSTHYHHKHTPFDETKHP